MTSFLQGSWERTEGEAWRWGDWAAAQPGEDKGRLQWESR